jgi:3',5'-cyclic AMP phosphodiesterase CpdA
MKKLGEKLFTFAVISDTHVNADENYCDSPFPVNALANKRFRHVVADINQRSVEFVVHLGDLLHPVPSNIDLYRGAAGAYRDIAARLNVPLHIIPGNHDIGDTPIAGAPTSPINNKFIDIWKEEFGAQYGSLAFGDITMLMINAQLINSGLADEAIQARWLEDKLSKSSKRNMLMLHHPIFLCEPDEAEHYDNTNAPGRQWILDLISNHNVEAVFCGHAHNFWYNRYQKTDIYLSPATSFVRQDYSEMLRAAPPVDSEFGRNDKAKLGYLLVDIYQFGHTVQFVRTYGQELASGQHPSTAGITALPPRANVRPFIGFDLRQNWAEITEVPPSGGLDEFERKHVRNDYPLLALIEMGVRDLRIPLSDLRDPTRCQRVKDLTELGFQFTLFGFGIPSDKDVEKIEQMREFIHAWEVTIDWNDFDATLQEISMAHQKTALPIFLSRLRGKADLEEGSKYFHVINHGFSSAGDEQLLARLSATKEQGIAGAVFRLSEREETKRAIDSIQKSCSELGLLASVHLRISGDDPAKYGPSQQSICERVETAIEAAKSSNWVTIFCDTLADVDRGYFPKSGAIDRSGNPNPLHKVVQNAHMLRSLK